MKFRDHLLCKGIHYSNSTQFKSIYRYALPFRFVVLFAIACVIGILITSVLPLQLSYQDFASEYFTAFSPRSFGHFFKNIAFSSLFDLSFLLAMWLSTLTFFCSAVLHFACALSGLVYGTCIGILVNHTTVHSAYEFMYVLFVSSFAILYALSATRLILINHSCLKQTRNAQNVATPFISQEIKQFVLAGAKTVCVYTIIRLIYCLLLAIIDI